MPTLSCLPGGTHTISKNTCYSFSTHIHWNWRHNPGASSVLRSPPENMQGVIILQTPEK